MSRARLGLYVFARVSLFQNCLELTPTFTQLVYRPLRLHLMPAEQHPTDRDVSKKYHNVVELLWDKMFFRPIESNLSFLGDCFNEERSFRSCLLKSFCFIYQGYCISHQVPELLCYNFWLNVGDLFNLEIGIFQD